MMSSKYLKMKMKKKEKKMNNHPFFKGVCLKVFMKKPKKPNSANSKVSSMKLSNGLTVTAAIPGESRNLNQHSVVLVKHAKLKDLPGVKFKVISNKFDCSPVLISKTSSSKYGKSKMD